MIKLKDISALMLLIAANKLISMNQPNRAELNYDHANKQLKSSSTNIQEQIVLLDLPEELIDYIFQNEVCLELFEKLNQIKNLSTFCRCFDFGIYPDHIKTVENFYRHVKFAPKYFDKTNVYNFLNFRSTCKIFNIISHNIIKKIKNKFIKLKKITIQDIKNANLSIDVLNKMLENKLNSNDYSINNLEECCKLIISGANTNAVNKNGVTTLAWTTMLGYNHVAQLILARNDVNVNIIDSYGNTALMWATMEGHSKIAKALLKKNNININVKNNHNSTALIFAALQGHIKIAKFILSKKNIDINVKNAKGETALIFAARKNCTKIAELLLEKDNININIQDGWGNTALMWATMNGYNEITKLLLEKDNININAKNKYDNTALIFAVYTGRPKVVELILSKPNVDVNTKNKSDETALDIAQNLDNQEITELITKHAINSQMTN